LYGAFLALKPTTFGELGSGGVIFIQGRPVTLPVGPVLRAIAIVVSLIIALVTGAGMMSNWSTFALWWYARGAPLSAAPQAADPVFGRPIPFYLFTLPAWQLLAGWLTTLAVIACAMALFFRLTSSASQMVGGRSRF